MLYPSFLMSFILAALITPLIIRWYRKNNWLDDPRIHHHVKITHDQAVPRGGGLVIFASTLSTCLIFLPLTYPVAGLFAGALIITIAGFIDDLRDSSPYMRLVIGAVAALLLVAGGIRLEFITNPFSTGVLNFSQLLPNFQLAFIPTVLSVIWVVWN